MILFLDSLAVFVLIILAVIGYQRGFVEELGRLLGLVLATLVGVNGYLPLAKLFLARFSWDGPMTAGLSFAGLFILVLIIIRLLTRLVQIMLLSRTTRLADRLLGFIFGFGKGGFVLILVVWIVTIFPAKAWAQTIREQSALFERLDRSRLQVVRLFRLEDNLERGEQFMQRWVSDKQTREENSYNETRETIE